MAHTNAQGTIPTEVFDDNIHQRFKVPSPQLPEERLPFQPFQLPGKVPRRRKVAKKKSDKAIKSVEVVKDVASDPKVEVDNNAVTEAIVFIEDGSSEVDTLEVIASDDGL